jgi:hypothetical protein
MDTLKPSRRTSKRLTWSSFVFGWGTLWLGMFLGPEIAAIISPSMVAVITMSSIGYMGIGHADLRVISAIAAGKPDKPEPAPQPEEAKP